MNIGIVGLGPNWKDAPFEDPDWEFWGMNTGWTKQPVDKFTRWYEIHDIRAMYVSGEQAIDRPDHLEWLSDLSRGVEVTMLPKEARRYLNTRPLPVLDLLNEFGGYFTNTASWMLAEALHIGPERIGLFGLNLEQPHEQAWERPSVEYFIGLARGRGTQVILDEGSNLLSTPYVYGVDQPTDMRHVWRRRLEDYEQRIGRYEDLVARLRGAADEVRLNLAEWER